MLLDPVFLQEMDRSTSFIYSQISVLKEGKLFGSIISIVYPS
jgi:hypothetical protein